MTQHEIHRLMQEAARCGVSVRITADGAITITPVGHPAGPKTPAERMRHFRQRKSTVTENVTVEPGTVTPVTPVTSVTSVTNNQDTPPSLPLSPQTPLSPTHPPALSTAHACEAAAFSLDSATEPQTPPKQRKKARLEDEARETARLVDLPLPLQIECFQALWSEWNEHRIDLAAKQRYPWTLRAAQMTLSLCVTHGVTAACEALKKAIAGGWKSVHFDTGSSRQAPARRAEANHGQAAQNALHEYQ